MKALKLAKLIKTIQEFGGFSFYSFGKSCGSQFFLVETDNLNEIDVVSSSTVCFKPCCYETSDDDTVDSFRNCIRNYGGVFLDEIELSDI